MPMNETNHYRAIVIGTSSGGFEFIKQIISGLSKDFQIPIIIVQHLHQNSNGEWIKLLDTFTALKIKEAEEKESIQPGYIYCSPANYHLMIEKDATFSLNIDELVNFSRPSIDVLFRSAAFAYQKQLIGIIGTGASKDGAEGLAFIKKMGGEIIVQAPKTATSSTMPIEAIKASEPKLILSPDEIISFLEEINLKPKLAYWANMNV